MEAKIPIRTFTLDTNCIIAVDERRAEANAIQALADAHAAGTATIAVVAISASEKQKNADMIESFTQFQQRLAALNLGHLDVLPALAYWDITFWEHSLWSDDEKERLEKEIHKVLFPNIEFLSSDFRLAHGLDSSDQTVLKAWRRAKCDVQALWSHIYHGRDVFVTTDRNFHKKSKKPALISLGANQIEYPDTAALLVPN